MAEMPDKHTPEQIMRLATETVRAAEQRARDFYAIPLPETEIDFSLRGRCAGQARVHRSGATLLRLNLTLLTENLTDFLKQTIPHEVAHLVISWQARQKNRHPRPHGPEWQSVMQNCYKLLPVRCHSYRTTPARIVPRNVLYRCGCREHRLTVIMHKRLSKSHQALCKSCRTHLKFVSVLAP